MPNNYFSNNNDKCLNTYYTAPNILSDIGVISQFSALLLLPKNTGISSGLSLKYPMWYSLLPKRFNIL